MLQKISNILYELVAFLDEGDGEIVKKFNPEPTVKPRRRNPSFKNKSNKSDYFKNYMKEYRSEGKDYQKSTDRIKEYRREQKKKIEEKKKP